MTSRRGVFLIGSFCTAMGMVAGFPGGYTFGQRRGLEDSFNMIAAVRGPEATQALVQEILAASGDREAKRSLKEIRKSMGSG